MRIALVVASAALLASDALADEQVVRATPKSDHICEPGEVIVLVHCDGPKHQATMISCDPQGATKIYKCSQAGYPLPPSEAIIPPPPPAAAVGPPAPDTPEPYIERRRQASAPVQRPARGERHAFHKPHHHSQPHWWDFLFKRGAP